MLAFLQDMAHFIALVGTLVSGGALLSGQLRRNKAIVVLCVVWSFVSFAYLFRPLLKSSDELFGSFDRPTCLDQAEINEGVMDLRTNFGVLMVRDPRRNLERSIDSMGQETYSTYQKDFRLFFDSANQSFSIILNLVDPPVTPGSAARSAAEFLQQEFCLEKQQICTLSYRMGAIRATNFLYPEINGQELYFEYCE